MRATVIDTLRYANRLKDVGVDGSQAEAMATAINDELVAGLATKDDVDHAVTVLKADLERMVDGLRTDTERMVEGLRTDTERMVEGLRTDTERMVDGLRTDTERMVEGLRTDTERMVGELRIHTDRTVGELRTDLVRVENELAGRCDTLDARLATLDSKFETQGRNMFLVLALIAALGLYNAVGPQVLRASPASAPASEASTSDPDQREIGSVRPAVRPLVPAHQ